MTTKCPKCGTVDDTDKPKLAFLVRESDYFPKRLPMTVVCGKCKTEFNIKLNEVQLKEKNYESSV